MSEESPAQPVVRLRLTQHVSSACRMCGRRNGVNEGFIEVDLLWRVTFPGTVESYTVGHAGPPSPTVAPTQPEKEYEVRAAQINSEHARCSSGFVMYCTDCYEMLRKAAVEDCKEFAPFYELVYEESILFPFPPELIVSSHDAFQLWRRKVDKEAWLEKLAADKAETGNPD